MHLQKNKSIHTFLLVGILFIACLADAEMKMYFVHNDHLGTPQYLTDMDQNVVWKVENQTPFGKVVVNEDPDGDGKAVEFNLRFAGQYYDKETGLNYNLNRYYDPSAGRYTQSDPIGITGGINTYAYVEGNPLNKIDPNGLSPRDVERIHDTFREYVDRNTLEGRRRSPGFLNNMSRFLYDRSSGHVGSNYLVCHEQADELIDRLNEMQDGGEFDDQWTFRRDYKGVSAGGAYLNYHYWVEGISNNLNDPYIGADPWRDRLDLDYGSQLEQNSDCGCQ